MRVRVHHAKLYAYALPGSTATVDSYSTARHWLLLESSTAQQLLDSSTDLDSYSTPRRMESASTSLDRLDRNSTGTRQARQARPRQRLDSASTAPRQCLDGASTEPRQLDSSTARAQAGSPDGSSQFKLTTRQSLPIPIVAIGLDEDRTERRCKISDLLKRESKFESSPQWVPISKPRGCAAALFTLTQCREKTEESWLMTARARGAGRASAYRDPATTCDVARGAGPPRSR